MQDKKYKGYKDLKVYQKAYSLAMQIFDITKTFPKEEKYSLIDQIRRSSRSVATNIVEGWQKRLYPKLFISKMIDSLGECGETEVWLNFSLDCGYLGNSVYESFKANYEEVNRMLFGMIAKPERFVLKIKKE
ncbi:MAG: four helix bundle protein [bacterium]